ncbi:CBS domain-containing protein [Mariprofundus sp. KV]|uniref:magnesium transporter MgtE N-terminal domain-containing protein n=1 Tax=Mariprofundus sp. KV TaxID=2608715 RepID=UPI0015A4C8DD|nr:CBS domain-containing protein [Mariprofundus sp. KV]NWF35928.1 CBS domain-containing protein [Mariprofundus sp. KV]
MTAKKADLALAFLQSHPHSAAALLEQQPMQEVALFLADVPPGYAAPVLEKMLPQYTAKLCTHLEAELAAGFLSRMEISMAAAVLRHLTPLLRETLLGLLSEKNSLSCKLLLDYSDDQVGAWMLVETATLPAECTVTTALTRIADNQANADVIYVVDRSGHIQGVVTLTQLLRSSTETSVTAVMRPTPEPISGRTNLIAAGDHQGWLMADTLPVINRHQQLVGCIRHVDLRKGMEQLDTHIDVPQGADPLSSMLEIYGGSLLALFGAAGDLIGMESRGRS